MLMEYRAVEVCDVTESVTVTSTLEDEPAAVGVPVRTPAVLSDRPAGSPVADQVAVPDPPAKESVVGV